MNQIISFLTDFGLSDTSVGQCKGVIAGISPRALVIDLSHAVPHFDIAMGAWLLRNALPHLPVCVHVAVIDPGVGTERRPVGIECARGDILIGPDNGLLLAAADRLGGVVDAVLLAEERFRHQPVSHTFHARDIFCPAAAHLVHGVSLHMLGPSLDSASLIRLPSPQDEIRDHTLWTAVTAVNEYGSLALAAPGSRLEDLGNPARVEVQAGARTFIARVTRTFGEASLGERVLLVDSYGQLCLAINQGDLAATLDISNTQRPVLGIRPSPADGSPEGPAAASGGSI